MFYVRLKIILLFIIVISFLKSVVYYLKTILKSSKSFKMYATNYIKVKTIILYLIITFMFF